MENLVRADKTERCPECGALVAGGRAGCQALYDALAAPGAGALGLSARRDLAFDAYCMQHPDTYCRSAKSYAAHLTRLCCGIEYGGDPKVYRAIQRWLNGAVPLEKPEVLTDRGQITVEDVQAAASPEEMERLAQAWAMNVWEVYSSQHGLAREWIRSAVSSSGAAKRG
jgi:Family of unknown function (DUF5946)